VINIKINDILLKVLKWCFVVAIIIFTVYPVAYAVIGSLKTNFELTSGGNIFPTKLMFSNYAQAFKEANFMKYTLNSVFLSIFVTIFAVITSSLAGYVFARHEFPGKKLIMGMYLSFMFISMGAVSIYPIFVLFNKMGLTNSLLGLALVLTGGQTVNVVLIMGFIKSLPKELDEAAIIDGCNFFQIYYKIILPLIKPIIGVVCLFSFRGAWNDYITSMIMTMSNPSIKPLTVAVVELKYSANAAAEWNIILAGACIALVPILIVYFFTNKQFIAGLTAGSVKG